MTDSLTERTRRTVSMARSFAEEEVAPRARQIDQQAFFPRELIAKLAEKGFLGAVSPKALGGLDLDPVAYGRLTEEIGKHCCNTRNLLTVHASIAQTCILRHGSRGQVGRWIPPMVRGERIGAFSITEPETGSDARHIRTGFRKEGRGWVISGRKKWTTFGGLADLWLVAAKNGEDMAVFIVEKDSPGAQVKPIPGLMASRGSHLVEIEFAETHVPAEGLLGRPGPGINDVVATAFDHARYSIAWGCVGLAQGALEAMIAYARRREQFEKKLRSYQLIQEMIADAATDIRAARSLALRVGELRKAGDRAAVLETTMAKCFCSQTAARIASDAVQLHGANGCCDAYPVERFYREAKSLEILEGTTQILKQVIAATVLAERA